MEKSSGHYPRTMLKTLERVFSKAGLGSRTEARSWIGARRVRVNGKIIEDPEFWVDLERDRVTLDGRPLQKAAKVYILLYKPKGFLTTYRDPEGRPTVYHLIQDVETWVVPVGRLDLDTSGLLLLTNDTDFADRIMSPESKVRKTYQVKTATALTGEQIAQLRGGVTLSDGPARAAEVKILRETPKYTHLEMILMEGRNRQVRRMLEAVGSKVLKLVRTAIGPIRIGDLPIGKWRELTAEEVSSLLTPPSKSRQDQPRLPAARVNSSPASRPKPK
jgi:23S rRNA pseudouridine2605 synthase